LTKEEIILLGYPAGLSTLASGRMMCLDQNLGQFPGRQVGQFGAKARITDLAAAV